MDRREQNYEIDYLPGMFTEKYSQSKNPNQDFLDIPFNQSARESFLVSQNHSDNEVNRLFHVNQQVAQDNQLETPETTCSD